MTYGAVIVPPARLMESATKEMEPNAVNDPAGAGVGVVTAGVSNILPAVRERLGVLLVNAIGALTVMAPFPPLMLNRAEALIAPRSACKRLRLPVVVVPGLISPAV